MASNQSVMLPMGDIVLHLPKDNSGTSLENLPNTLLQGNFLGFDCPSTSEKPRRPNVVSS